VTDRFGVVIHHSQPFHAAVCVFCDDRLTHIEPIFYLKRLLPELIRRYEDVVQHVNVDYYVKLRENRVSGEHHF